jgi:type VI secretion system protein ImpM
MNVTSDVARIPGWYGKLPTLGDFASRRLEADFIEPWDLWLGEALQAQRSAFGEGWLDAYLDTPPWRFLLSPGALRGVRSELAFAGVLVPSVDRVGRHFPLTLVASLARLPELAAGFDALLAWLHRLEDTALDALHGQWTIDDLENALAGMGPPEGANGHAVEDRVSSARRALADAMARRSGFVDIAGISSRADLAAIFAAPPGPPISPPPAMRGLAVWIADTPGRPQLLVSDGLPGIDDFIRMFSGGSGARSAGGRRDPAMEAEDPLATRPQGLGPPAFAASAPAGNDDLLSLFGRPAAAPVSDTSPRELLPDDDILALFKVGGDSAAGGLESPSEMIPEHDPLRMFEAGAAPAPPEATTPLVNDDILAMFSAGEAQPSEPGADASVSDPLGMFEVPPETRPFGASQAAPPLPQEAGSEPDILDMFGVVPEKPEGKEAK